MRIAVFGKRRQGVHPAQIGSLIDCLRPHAEIVVARRLADGLAFTGTQLPDGVAVADDDCAARGADLALSIGGDGTFLRTAHSVGRAGVPILGINTGSLGYLSAVTIDDPAALADDILHSRFAISQRSLIAVGINDTPADDLPWAFALNEVAITRQDTASMISLAVDIDGHQLGNYLGDGLIVATPTGSTAYNLSVGGPIIQPAAGVWAVSPVAAHSLTMRPLVISARSQLDITASSRSRSIRLSLDGQSTVLPTGTVLHLRPAPFTIGVMMRPGHTFADSLRTKLFWGVDPR